LIFHRPPFLTHDLLPTCIINITTWLLHAISSMKIGIDPAWHMLLQLCKTQLGMNMPEAAITIEG
jgi:hypothetical protein